jgi:hypothetical protein
MFLSAFWSGTDEDQLADQPTVLGGDLLDSPRRSDRHSPETCAARVRYRRPSSFGSRAAGRVAPLLRQSGDDYPFPWILFRLACFDHRTGSAFRTSRLAIRACRSGLIGTDANPRAVANFVHAVTDVQNIEAQFGPLPYPEIDLLGNARVDGQIFRQGRAIWHRWRTGAQAALRDEIHGSPCRPSS